jgi:hypothetical protein
MLNMFLVFSFNRESIMSIQAWNIVLNAVVAVLIVGYGVWLRNIVT